MLSYRRRISGDYRKLAAVHDVDDCFEIIKSSLPPSTTLKERHARVRRARARARLIFQTTKRFNHHTYGIIIDNENTRILANAFNATISIDRSTRRHIHVTNNTTKYPVVSQKRTKTTGGKPRLFT